MIPGGILPRTLCSVIFFFNATFKCWLRYGLRIDIPVRSIVSKVSLCTRASAKVIRLASSERSLFFDMSRFKIPLLFPRAFANSSNPTSVKAFLLMSRCCKVLFLSKNLEKAVIPSLLMIFPPTENS